MPETSGASSAAPPQPSMGDSETSGAPVDAMDEDPQWGPARPATAGELEMVPPQPGMEDSASSAAPPQPGVDQSWIYDEAEQKWILEEKGKLSELLTDTAGSFADLMDDRGLGGRNAGPRGGYVGRRALDPWTMYSPQEVIALIEFLKEQSATATSWRNVLNNHTTNRSEKTVTLGDETKDIPQRPVGGPLLEGGIEQNHTIRKQQNQDVWEIVFNFPNSLEPGDGVPLYLPLTISEPHKKKRR